MTMLRDKLEILLRSIREWAEFNAPTYAERTEVNLEDLTGMCAPASIRLHTDLLLAGFEPTLAVSYCDNNVDSTGHVYVICDDMIMDPTASQFDKHTKYLLKQITPELVKAYPYRPYYTSGDSDRFIAELIDHGWSFSSVGLESYEDSDSGI